jgi:hypothetical protein
MNSHNARSKILFGIIIVAWSLTAAILNVNVQRAIAVELATATRTNDPTISQTPFYIELDKPTSQKAVVVNQTIHATEVTFSGHGTVKGINFTDSGKGLIIPRGNTGIINVKGQVSIVTDNGDRGSFNFQETRYPPAGAYGTIKATGAAFFDANATGKLAFLDNTVAIYKHQIYKNGTDRVIAWQWKESYYCYFFDCTSWIVSVSH